MLRIIFGDISSITADAIVNPTDSFYSGGGGVDYALHERAGRKDLMEATSALPLLETGMVQVTPAFNLNARMILHTTGPIWDGGGYNEEALLRSSYVNALLEAAKRGCRSIAFPLIASGTFGFPKGAAMAIASSAICDFLTIHDMLVTLVLHSSLEGDPFLSSFGEYIEKNYNGRKNTFVAKTTETFDQMLCRLQGDRKGSDIYLPAQINKAYFSKLKSGSVKNPSKGVVLALAMGLRLDKDTASLFLASAGYTFSSASIRDLYVVHLLENREYDVVSANIALDAMNADLLGT